MHLPLTKHHGLGNDFLVLLDLTASLDAGPDLARAVCDRATGVGADGLIRARPDDEADVRMELWNSDGSSAELSGNGLRCLAQALVIAEVAGPSMTIATARGIHALDLPAWRRIDAAEVALGTSHGRLRTTLAHRVELLDAARPPVA